jgi:hypothetical protein
MSLAFQIAEFDGYTIGNFFLALGEIWRQHRGARHWRL